MLRDLSEAATVLQRWLGTRLAPEGEVWVTDISRFPLGQSGDLLNLDAEILGSGGRATRGLVVRVEPQPAYQLFLDTNFEPQYRVMEAMARADGVPVPAAVGFEEDPSVLGDRFYVMERVAGEAGDSGLEWVKRLGPEKQSTMWATGLRAMAGLHRADWRGLGLGLLDDRDRGEDPVEQQLSYYAEYFDWVREGESRPIIEVAFDWLREHRPTRVHPSITWGDARPGNQLYTAFDHCSAIIDLEQVCLGTAESDLGWWCYVEDQRRRAFGVECPALDETVRLYGTLLERPVESIEYYLVFAALRIAVLRIKLHVLRAGQPDRYGKYDGDRNLAAAMCRHVPDLLDRDQMKVLRPSGVHA
jgi:aminoglycoside phosphotransferase (APT) family kinase protein